MGKIVYNKLVRDKIPAIIKADNQIPVTIILDDKAYKHALLEKLVEEAKELLQSNGDISERADVAEVLKAIDKIFYTSGDSIESTRIEKLENRGGFEDKIFLKEAIKDD